MGAGNGETPAGGESREELKKGCLSHTAKGKVSFICLAIMGLA